MRKTFNLGYPVKQLFWIKCCYYLFIKVSGTVTITGQSLSSSPYVLTIQCEISSFSNVGYWQKAGGSALTSCFSAGVCSPPSDGIYYFTSDATGTNLTINPYSTSEAGTTWICGHQSETSSIVSTAISNGNAADSKCPPGCWVGIGIGSLMVIVILFIICYICLKKELCCFKRCYRNSDGNAECSGNETTSEVKNFIIKKMETAPYMYTEDDLFRQCSKYDESTVSSILNELRNEHKIIKNVEKENTTEFMLAKGVGLPTTSTKLKEELLREKIIYLLETDNWHEKQTIKSKVNYEESKTEEQLKKLKKDSIIEENSEQRGFYRCLPAHLHKDTSREHMILHTKIIQAKIIHLLKVEYPNMVPVVNLIRILNEDSCIVEEQIKNLIKEHIIAKIEREHASGYTLAQGHIASIIKEKRWKEILLQEKLLNAIESADPKPVKLEDLMSLEHINKDMVESQLKILQTKGAIIKKEDQRDIFVYSKAKAKENRMGRRRSSIGPGSASA